MNETKSLTRGQRTYRSLRNDPVRWAKRLAQMRIFSKTASAKAARNIRQRGKSGPYLMGRYHSEPQFKLRMLAAVYVNKCVTIYGAKKTKNTMQYVGCDKAQLVSHIEKQFTSGMCWENYGKWEIDHIIPLSKWDLTDQMQMGLANHITEGWQLPLV